MAAASPVESPLSGLPQTPKMKHIEALCFADSDIEIRSRLPVEAGERQYGFRLHKAVLSAYSRVFGDMVVMGTSESNKQDPVILEENGPDLERLFSFMYAPRFPSFQLYHGGLSLVGTREEGKNFACLAQVLIVADKYGVDALTAAVGPMLQYVDLGHALTLAD